MSNVWVKIEDPSKRPWRCSYEELEEVADLVSKVLDKEKVTEIPPSVVKIFTNSGDVERDVELNEQVSALLTRGIGTYDNPLIVGLPPKEKGMFSYVLQALLVI
jgi:hypothetical protein